MQFYRINICQVVIFRFYNIYSKLEMIKFGIHAKKIASIICSARINLMSSVHFQSLIKMCTDYVNYVRVSFKLNTKPFSQRCCQAAFFLHTQYYLKFKIKKKNILQNFLLQIFYLFKHIAQSSNRNPENSQTMYNIFYLIIKKYVVGI